MGLIVVVGMYTYLHMSQKPDEEVLVNYAEKVGKEIIEHEKPYTAAIYYKKDMMEIKKLGVKRPIPKRDVFIHTQTGKKKLYLIRFDNYRYGFRIPTTNESIMVYKRDDEGNVEKDKNNKPIIIKKQWKFAENVIEPDVIHWEEAELIKNQERHKIKANFWDKWGAPMSLAMIFLFGIISMNMLTKEWKVTKDAIFESADIEKQRAEDVTKNLNNLLEKVTGNRVFDEETNDRARYYNQTTS